jgi:hypothetical protein
MANAVFNTSREGHLGAEIDFDTAVIKAALVRGYTYASSHKFVSDVTGAGGTLAATSGALTSKTITNGTADAADVTFTAVASNASGHGILVFQSSAVGGGADVAATAQRVICWLDTGTNLPISPNGGDISIAWNASGIYSI